MSQHFQLYEDPRAGSLASKGGTEIVSVLGVLIDGSKPTIYYLVVGGKGVRNGSQPRMVNANLVDIAVVQHG